MKLYLPECFFLIPFLLKILLVCRERFTPVLQQEMKVTELDISLGVNRESLSAPGIILPLPLLDVGLHDHPLQVLDGAQGHRLLLGVYLIIQLDKSKLTRVELT